MQVKYIPFIVTMMFNEKTNELIPLNGFNVISSHSPRAIKSSISNIYSAYIQLPLVIESQYSIRKAVILNAIHEFSNLWVIFKLNSFQWDF
jgi:hypothetical protein